MQEINAEVVAVGTELLLGQIANTNAQWISKRLAETGVNVFHHTVVGDNLKRVYEQFTVSAERSDVILITGGLGPTEDDMTREAFQQLSGLNMIEHQSSMAKITQFYHERGAHMTENNRKQARVFEGAEILENRVGMAPGMILRHDGKVWVFMPGVPREMKQILNDGVLPYLQELLGGKSVIESEMLLFTGIGESTLEDRLRDIIQTQSNPTIAPLAKQTGVAVRVTAKANDKEEASQLIGQVKEKILKEVGEYYYGSDELTLEERIIDLLKTKELKIGAAESLTGGLFTENLISVPGASEVCQGGLICYATSIKEKVLGVRRETINSYGTVSKQCATEMAENVRDLMDADIGVSFTGVAGPEIAEGKSVGTVWIAVATTSSETIVREFIFNGGRPQVRDKAVQEGLNLIYNLLK